MSWMMGSNRVLLLTMRGGENSYLNFTTRNFEGTE